MSAPDFYFAINSMFRYLHDTYGKDVLVDYWRKMGHEYYRQRSENWRENGPSSIAEDWKSYFQKEPHAEVETSSDATSATLEIRVCPSIKHLRDNGREIVPYFCEHCDHVCGAMAEDAGYSFERTGGMGSCRQVFTKLTVRGGNR
ncbi:MAG: hypothetical protein IT446_08055 [Phycisphaerales bacterium]|jgi:hypothetical protein|nr:hypothetical protein [Phycisphaerales bacterium]